MRFRSLCLSLAASTLLALPATAAPVFVSPTTAKGPVPAHTKVVLFSYDVRTVHPQVAARFEQWRPTMPTVKKPETTKLALLPDWKDYHLMAAMQLEEYPRTFERVHADEPELIEQLVPRLKAVYEKHGPKAPAGYESDVLVVESARKAWCKRVASEINAILVDYNNGSGPDSHSVSYERALARWHAKRNEALQAAAAKAGANATISFVEGVTNARGVVNFDVPVGAWWVACQVGEWSWYKQVKVSERGGHLVLTPTEARPDPLSIAEWTGD